MDIFEEYAKKMCITCKAEKCDKGICMLISDHLEVRCVDYIKDETKIIEPEKDIFPTAKKINPVNKRFM
jgi:hypothetical protein